MFLKVSIITVVYNAVKTIEQTIKSVMNQSYSNIEYIVIDGGSKDGTLDIIKKYEKRITHWVSEPDNGIYDAMNKGIKYATGDIIAFINADDYYEKNIIDKISQEFINSEVDVIYGKIKRLYDNGFERITKPLSENNLHILMCMCHQAVFAKRELFFKYGLFNLDYKIAADYEALLKWYNAGAKFMYIDEVIANYGVEGFSSIEIEKCAEEVYNIALKFLDTEEKKEKYFLKIEENKFLLDRNIEKKRNLKDKEEIIIRNLKLFLSDNKKVFIWGCGMGAVDCYKLFVKSGCVFHGYIDNDSKKCGMKLKEYFVYPSSILTNSKAKIVVSTAKYGAEISSQLEKMGYKHKKDFIFLDDLLECDFKVRI